MNRLSHAARPMNRLSHAARTCALSCLLDGMSMRATSRVAGVSFSAVRELLIQAGEVAADYHDAHVRNVTARYVQADEIWAYIYAKSGKVLKMENPPEDAGSIWTWTAMDAESKLIISYLVGGRSMDYAHAFMLDLAKRVAGRVQLTTDGYSVYVDAVNWAFGRGIDYAQDQGFGIKEVISGDPDPDHISTAYVERQNLTMRMCMRRFTRATNAFSKKSSRHAAMVSLHFLNYNWVRIHQTLRVTPAMAAGLTDTLYDVGWIAELVEEALPAPGPRGPYRPRKNGQDS